MCSTASSTRLYDCFPQQCAPRFTVHQAPAAVSLLTMDLLDTLDWSDFYSGDEFQRAELCRKLLHSFQQNGFVKLVNHGLSAEYVTEGLRYVRKHHWYLPPVEQRLSTDKRSRTKPSLPSVRRRKRRSHIRHGQTRTEDTAMLDKRTSRASQASSAAKKLPKESLTRR
jgi:isopenicillin N synthase-like dioxygenase